LLNQTENIFPLDSPGKTDIQSRLAGGDQEAFQEFFEANHRKVFNYIFRVVKSREVSEELMLDIFVKVWSAKEMMVDVKNIDAFLYRMALNKALDFLKTAARESKLKTLLLNHIQSQAEAYTDENYSVKEFENQLKGFIDQLPPQQQLILSLSREEGLSHQQIAEQLLISKNTVKNHLVTALKTLRRHIKGIHMLICLYIFHLL